MKKISGLKEQLRESRNEIKGLETQNQNQNQSLMRSNDDDESVIIHHSEIDWSDTMGTNH